MTTTEEDQVARIRAAFGGADNAHNRRAMAEFAIGVLAEVSETRAEVAKLAARVPSEAHAAMLHEVIELGISTTKIVRWMHRRANNFRSLVLWVAPIIALYAAIKAMGVDVAHELKGWFGGVK